MYEKEEFVVDGFSSEEEILKEEVIAKNSKEEQTDHLAKEKVKFKIPPPQEIKTQSYSLKPDTVTGWAMKSDYPLPVPLLFENRKVETIIKKHQIKQPKNIQLCYLGPKYDTTYYAWLHKPFPFPYERMQSKSNQSTKELRGGNRGAKDCLEFQSDFESGNLDCAFRVGENEYDLYLRVDSNTKGHIQWYNFKILNPQKLQKYRLNICNFQKQKSLYSRGMKPYFYSEGKATHQKIGWHQAGEFVKYERKQSKVTKAINMDVSSLQLSFEFYTEYDQDQLQLAYCVPYMYSQLCSFLKDLKRKSFLKITKLCQSLGGLDVPLVVIHDEEPKQSLAPKKCIIISGRVHPGQSNGSYMMEGFLKFICGTSTKAQQLRKTIVFKIVPMLNPDGVALGNYRTGISGKDFNREYKDPDREVFPEIYAFKKLVAENKAIYGDNLLMFIDFHGHSVKKNVFMYGPEFPIIDRNYYEARVFPKILSSHTEMFRYYSCIFKISAAKATTARAIFLRKLMISCSYTIEASNGSYYDHESLKNIAFTCESWVKMGEHIGFSLNEYCQLVISNEKIKLERQHQKRLKGHKASIDAREERKLRILYQEIKKLEEEREFCKNSEDEMSEGSSDGEDEKQDLPASKIKQLFQIIKSKKSHQEREQLFRDNQLENSQHFRTETVDDYDKNQNVGIGKSKSTKDKKPRQFLNRRNPINLRSHNRASSLKSEKEAVTTKIINFSFIGETIQILTKPDPIGIKHESFREEKELPQIKETPKIGNVFGADEIFMRTMGVGRKNEAMDVRSEKKRSKFEQFKYKRILLDHYQL